MKSSRKFLLVCIVLLASILLASCQGVKNQIIGTWEAEGMSTAFEFHKDGTFTELSGELSVAEGEYNWVDKDTIEIGYLTDGEIDYFDPIDVSIDGDVMTFTNADLSISFTRIK